ncbi:hypothetical protein [Bacteroides sp. 519]|uniref:hypothetical protein n=1 Tax=Bacteroides sp. 519 TaxID=2302937 RepID=UPI0013D625AC|nr:hypothetical protein [Bacteroides sp. 519]NDV58345.1 hypothetical protein [Bacteroides sp. 519]
MKDTVITARRKKTEILTFLFCFLIANLANLYSIIAYKTSYIELITSIGYVVVGSVVLYILWSILRGIFYGILYLIRRKDK